MKKVYLALFPLLLTACTNTDKAFTTENLIGEWVCTTEYKDLHVGTVDIITLNADGTLQDDNYILDHSMSILVGKRISNYFSSPLRYLKVYEGKWDLSDKTLTYNLKMKSINRLIWKDVWDGIQNIEVMKNIEAESFKIYSSDKDEEIKLSFNKFIRNGFILNQNLNGKTYESKCLNKKASKHSYVEAYKEIYKEIHKVK